MDSVSCPQEDELADWEEAAGISAPLYEIVDTLFELQSRGFFRRQVWLCAPVGLLAGVEQPRASAALGWCSPAFVKTSVLLTHPNFPALVWAANVLYGQPSKKDASGFGLWSQILGVEADRWRTHWLACMCAQVFGVARQVLSLVAGGAIDEWLLSWLRGLRQVLRPADPSPRVEGSKSTISPGQSGLSHWGVHKRHSRLLCGAAHGCP